jgi:putative flippase GtrA
MSKLIHSTFVKFCIVGGIATSLQYLILFVGVRFVGIDPVLASSMGFAVSACANYLLNNHFTFGRASAHITAGPRFLVMICAGCVLNALCMIILGAIGQHYLVSQVIATVVVLLFNFFVSSRWVFRGKGGSNAPPAFE